jgi:hypothetical protein
VGLGAAAPLVQLPGRTSLGPLFCIIDGPTRGRAWSGAAVRSEFRRLAAQAGLRRRFAPHQLRHAHALELAARASRSTSLSANSGTPTSARPRSTCKESPRGIIATVRTRRAPMMSASAPGCNSDRPRHYAGAPRRSRFTLRNQARRRASPRPLPVVPCERLAALPPPSLRTASPPTRRVRDRRRRPRTGATC